MSTEPQNPRRIFTFTESEAERLKKLAAANGTSVSGMLRGWIEDFIERGSGLRGAPREERKEIQVVMSRQVAAAADKKAMTENGTSLLNVLRKRLDAEEVTRDVLK